MEIQSLEQFQSLINEDKITAIDFFATWCGPCKMLGPVFSSIADEMKADVNFVKVDIDKFNEIASMYGVQSVPTIVYTKAGTELTRTVGFMDADALKAKINSLK